MKIRTPLGIGEFRRFEEDKIVVEMDWSHEVRFPWLDCKLLPGTVWHKRADGGMEIITEGEYGCVGEKRKIKPDWPLTVSLLLGLILMPVCVYLAYLERGYFAMGGEYLAGALPVLGLYLYRWGRELLR